MPSLPETPFQLKGGCFCSAIRYTISVPTLQSRPKIPSDPKREIYPPNAVTERLPMITLDHYPAVASLDPSSSPEYLMPSKELQEKTYLTHFLSSEDVNRTFCGRCGTHLTYYCSEPVEVGSVREAWGPIFDVANGTIDREGLEMEGFRPSRRGWLDDGIEWVKKLLGEGEGSLKD
ncbi:hypothetical protein ONS95_012870 [Cadophora gregata]|uniref:uncharacterized protein n=1 Tax=Cadophora gregata TaxID=51156 RepID=UPI0026DDC29F|nr:uncharacterized protein ONS95_012870 [Cadophora gregata]KAK0101151.1 hypothetical protein ONS96_006373 [Cadophora gregata f. sp. sojae]KAK0115819.1 hypothetical protein ONS95_012870 [Cadophora gregata]